MYSLLDASVDASLSLLDASIVANRQVPHGDAPFAADPRSQRVGLPEDSKACLGLIGFQMDGQFAAPGPSNNARVLF
jgi:hypothetical protein